MRILALVLRRWISARYSSVFYHAESQVGVEERSGSGLGLAIVKSIAERHGGKVWFESKLGRGSSFYLQIPLKQSKKSD